MTSMERHIIKVMGKFFETNNLDDFMEHVFRWDEKSVKYALVLMSVFMSVSKKYDKER